MTIHLAAMTGGFPRTRGYARVMTNYLKGRLDREDLYREAYKRTLKIMERLVRYGVDILNDGMYLTDDLFNPFQEDLENTEKGWLVRFYENNNFVRNIVVKGPIGLKDNPRNFIERLKLIKQLRERLPYRIQYRIPVPGPLTFYRFSYFRTDYTTLRFIRDYVDHVLLPLQERALKEKIYLEIHEPSLAVDRIVSTDEYSSSIKPLQHRFFLKTYFGGLKENIVKNIGENAIVGIDLVEGSPITATNNNSVELGIIDSRNTRLESLEELVSIADKYEGFEEVYLSTNTILEFLPEKIAYRKMRLLGRLKRKLEG